MQFVCFALVCVIAVQAAFVSAYPAAGAQAGEKSVAQLHEEYNKAGAQLQADLIKARAREDFKGDAHLQAVLNGIEEVDKKFSQLALHLVDTKHTLSQSEMQKLNSDAQALKMKIQSEVNLMKPEHRQDQLFRQIEDDCIEGSRLLTQMALTSLMH